MLLQEVACLVPHRLFPIHTSSASSPGLGRPCVCHRNSLQLLSLEGPNPVVVTERELCPPPILGRGLPISGGREERTCKMPDVLRCSLQSSATFCGERRIAVWCPVCGPWNPEPSPRAEEPGIQTILVNEERRLKRLPIVAIRDSVGKQRCCKSGLSGWSVTNAAYRTL